MPRSKEDLAKLLEPSTDKQSLIDLLGYITYAGDPTNNVTPNFIGEECFDTSGAHWYRASTTASSGWKKLNN